MSFCLLLKTRQYSHMCSIPWVPVFISLKLVPHPLTWWLWVLWWIAHEKVEWQGADTHAMNCLVRYVPREWLGLWYPVYQKIKAQEISLALGQQTFVWWSSSSNRSFFSHRMVSPSKSQILVGMRALLDFVLWKFVLLGEKTRKKRKEGEKCRHWSTSLRRTDGTVWQKLKESKGRYKCLCASELTADWKEPKIHGMVWICFSLPVPGKQNSVHILNKQAAPHFSVMISLADSSSGRNSMQGHKLFPATYG